LNVVRFLASHGYKIIFFYHMDVVNERILHVGLSFSKVPRAEPRQCQSNKECQNYSCPIPSEPYCFDGECKCGEALNVEVLKDVAKACKSNNDCQNVCEDPFNALCVNGECSCN
jgi:hypothetical protein